MMFLTSVLSMMYPRDAEGTSYVSKLEFNYEPCHRIDAYGYALLRHAW